MQYFSTFTLLFLGLFHVLITANSINIQLYPDSNIGLVATLTQNLSPSNSLLLNLLAVKLNSSKYEVSVTWGPNRTTVTANVFTIAKLRSAIASLNARVNANCMSFEWLQAPHANIAGILEDCISLQVPCVTCSRRAWYGGPELFGGSYTMGSTDSSDNITMQPFLSGDIYDSHGKLGGVLKAHWLSSDGWSIEVDEDVSNQPLWVSFNDITGETHRRRSLCIRSDYDSFLNVNLSSPITTRLQYRICHHGNTEESWNQTILSQINHTVSSPVTKAIEDPIWSTWAEFKKEVNQTAVIAYAHKIVLESYPHSVIEIDDKWSSAYGDFTFDPLKFPDPATMISSLHAMNFSVTLWVQPFCEPHAVAFEEGMRLGFWVTQEVEWPEQVDSMTIDEDNASALLKGVIAYFRHRNASLPLPHTRLHVPLLMPRQLSRRLRNRGSVDVDLNVNISYHASANDTMDDSSPAKVKWWDSTLGGSAVLDVTNPSARAWFLTRLHTLKASVGVDGFKFDAGETAYIPNPRDPRIHYFDPSLLGVNGSRPLMYTKLYVSMAAESGNLTEVRSSWQTQDLGVFVRVMDLDSNWGSVNGLESALNRVLLFSTLGYRYALPDMVGGNGYGSNGNLDFLGMPDPELYIRWLQMNLLMPMQLSIPPWRYEVEGHAQAPLVIQATANVFALRKRLLPLLSSAIAVARTTGVPVIRPMWAAHWDDNSTVNGSVSESSTANTSTLSFADVAWVQDQYMIGDNVLIAPILFPNVTQRYVVFPPGDWIPCTCYGAALSTATTGPGIGSQPGGESEVSVDAGSESGSLRPGAPAVGGGVTSTAVSMHDCNPIKGPANVSVPSPLLLPPPCFVRA